MKKKIFIFGFPILIIIALGFIIVSCNKEKFSDKPNDLLSTRNSQISNEQIYNIRKAFAKALLSAMREEPALRTFIKNKCLLADRSDYELVYLSLKDNIVTRGLTFSQVLTTHAPQSLREAYGVNFFNQIVNDVPLLTISFPDLLNISLNDWTENLVPDVAAVSTINLKSCTMYSPEDLLGFELSLSEGQIEEDVIDRPVLVIYDAEKHYLVNNEGFTYDGVNIDSYMPRGGGDETIYDCWKYYLESQQSLTSYLLSRDGELQQFYLAEHNELLEKYMDCLNLFDVTEFTTDLDNPCQRDHEILDERLVSFKINNFGVLESIRNQVFEKEFKFHADIMALSRNSFGEIKPFNRQFVSPSYKRSELISYNGLLPNSLLPAKWITVNYRWYTDWKQHEIGSPIEIKWAEVDGGTSTTTLKLGLKSSFKVPGHSAPIEASGEVSYSYTGSAIVELGNAPVFYCDPLLKENDTGSITFTVN